MKAIMVATDGSPAAERALDLGIELAHDAGAVLHVVAVRPQGLYSRVDPAPGERLDVRHRYGAHDIAVNGAARARAAGVDAHAHWLGGVEAQVLQREAARLGVDLLVVGSRGLGGVKGRLLGSVSRQLVLDCPAPVLVVKTPRVQQALEASALSAGLPFG